jgi:outer membrane protein assembly factor BamB
MYMSVATDGSKLFFGGGNATNCVDIATQSEDWTFGGLGDKVTTTPAACDGVVYFATGKNEKKLYAVDIATGNEVWNRSLYGSLSSPAISDGKIYVGDKDKKINCINATDGSMIWNQTLGGVCLSSPVVANGMVYTTANYGQGTIYGFDADDGALKWTYDTGNWNMAQPSVSDGILFVGSDTGHLYAFSNMAWDGEVDLTPGTVNVTADNSGVEYMISSTCAMYALIKSAEAGGFNYSISDAWYDDFGGALYFDMIYDRHESGSTGWLYRVNYPDGSQPPSPNLCELEDGDLITWYWGLDMGATPDNSDMLIRISASIATATASDWTQFHCDIANTGNSPADAPDTNHTKWISADINASEASQAIIACDRVFVYASAAGVDDAIYALNRATGSVEWSATFPGETEDWGSSTTPAYTDGVVFAAAGYNVTGFDAATGTKLQEIAFPDGGYLSNGGVTVADGMVFVGSGNGTNYYALNASDLDDVIWSYTPNLTRAYSTPAVADERVVFGDAGWGYDDGYLYCVNEFTGTEVWSTNLTGLVWGSATIDAANNRVYVATAVDWTNDEGKLYALTFDTGAVRWSADINYTSSTPAVSGEYIYVAASGAAPGVTYCFDSSGVEQWNVPSGSRKISPAVADGKLFTGNVGLSGMASAGTEGINAYDAATGALIWQYEYSGSSPSVAEDADGNGIVVSIGTDGMVYAFGSSIQDWTQFHYDTANTGNSPADAPDTSHTKWISEDIGAVTGSQAMIAGDLVFVYANVTVYGLDRDTGAELWSALIPGDTRGFDSWASSAYSNDAIFVSAGYNLTKIDVNGNKLQEIAFPDGGYSCNGGPTVADGMVFAGSGSTNYYAFDESNLNNVIWTYPVILGTAVSTPAVADEKVVFGEMSWGGSSNLFCVNKSENASAPGTTDTNWVTTLTGGIGGSASIDAANNRVYVATFTDYVGDAGMLYAVNFTTGAVVWNRTITYSDSTPAISGDYIYVSGSVNAQGLTYCFNSTGTLQWTVPCGSWTMSPTVADGKLFTGSVGIWGADGICVFNATTGDPIWQYEYAGSSPSVAEDADGSGIVVSIGTDGMVYAFGGEVMMGDVNNDGEVTAADAVIALQMAVGAVPTNEEADVNRDGAVTSLDALMIMQAVAGAITI